MEQIAVFERMVQTFSSSGTGPRSRRSGPGGSCRKARDLSCGSSGAATSTSASAESESESAASPRARADSTDFAMRKSITPLGAFSRRRVRSSAPAFPARDRHPRHKRRRAALGRIPGDLNPRAAEPRRIEAPMQNPFSPPCRVFIHSAETERSCPGFRPGRGQGDGVDSGHVGAHFPAGFLQLRRAADVAHRRALGENSPGTRIGSSPM
jgi:hypothetical protein